MRVSTRAARASRKFGLLLLVCASSALAPRASFADENEHYAAGVKAFQDAEYEKAISELNASIAAQPSSKAAIYLGNAYLKLGRLAAAKGALQTALRLDPHSQKREAITALIRNIDARTQTKVMVTSTPPGATVFVDSQKPPARGKTPIELTLSPGHHQLFTVLEGYDTDTNAADLKAGETVSVDIPLRIKGCDLKLTAVPADGHAAVDGGAPVKLPATVRIAKGDHKVRFTGEGFDPKEETVSCDGTQPVTLDTALVAAIQKGRIKIPTEAGTTVLVDGKPIDIKGADALGGLGLPVGRHEVKITGPNKATYTTIVEVTSGTEVAVAEPTAVATPEKIVAPAPPPPPAFPAHGLYVGVDVGGNIVLNDWNLGTNAFISQGGKVSTITHTTEGIHPGSSGMAGIRVGFQIISRLAAEAELHAVLLPNLLDTSKGIAYNLNGVFNVLDARWTPIVQGGVGFYQVVSGQLGSATDLRTHLGVGLRGRINDSMTLRIDARDVISNGFGGVSNNVELLAGIELFAWKTSP